MTVRKLKAVAPRLEALVSQDRDLLKTLAKEALEQVLQGNRPVTLSITHILSTEHEADLDIGQP